MPVALAVGLSVVVPTRNRAAQVRGLLESLRRCAVPAGVGVELIVVDNGSTDATRRVVEQAAGAFPYAVRYVSEPVAGASRARNAGIRQAAGAVVAFTDDDCTVAEDWLTAIWSVFAERPGLAGVFGRVLPSGGGPVTAATLSVKDAADAADFRFPCSPFIGHGDNMAFRRGALLQVGGFDAAFGPGAPLRAAEELEMTIRLLRRGAWLRYEPGVLARHLPRPTEAEMLSAHRRNAIGLAACFTKHSLRGDGYALKTAWWWWRSTWRGWRQAARDGAVLVRRVKAAYLQSFLLGIGIGLGYETRVRLGLGRGAGDGKGGDIACSAI